MTYFMVDVETDGPAPGVYSMIAIGAVVVEPGLSRTYHSLFAPISAKWQPEALAVSGYTREETLYFEDPSYATLSFCKWVDDNTDGRAFFISDNNGFDWQFVNYYCWRYNQGNPFGYSSTNLGSLYKGLVGDMSKSFKHLRQTQHDHNPVNDAIGNAEALLYMRDELGLKIKL